MGLRVLVSGFETFSDHKINPSEQLINELLLSQQEFEFVAVVLPVTFAESYKILEKKIIEYKPHYVISFGLAEKRHKISIEERAHNRIHSKIPDNQGYLITDTKILENGESSLKTSINLNSLIKSLEFFPLEISQDAGAYVCNFLYYHLLSMEQKLSYKALFIHLPLHIPNLSYLEFAKLLIQKIIEQKAQA